MILFRTPHPSAKEIKLKNRKGITVMVRHGASSKVRATGKKFPYEINSIAAINRNADKAKMKEIFAENGITTTESMENTAENRAIFKAKGWNVVFKRRNHKRAIGMEFFKLDDIDKLKEAKYNGGLIERRINIKREWRVQCCPKLNTFYALEKRRRHSAAGNPIRNLESCIFKETFDEPANWNEGKELCKKAIEAIGLDTGAVDLALSSGGNWYVIETNSGPGLGVKSRAWYQDVYQKLVDGIEI